MLQAFEGRRLVGSALVALLVSACGPAGPRLGDPQNLRLWVIHSSDFQVSIGGSGGCLVLSGSATATVNGEAAGEFFRGHLDSGGFLLSCSWPTITIPAGVADAPETTIAFEDGDARVSASLLDFGTPLSVTLVPPADGHIRAGSTVGVRWTPASESLRNQSWAVDIGARQDGSRIIAMIDTTSLQGGQGSFVVPTSAQPGQTALMISGARTPEVATCDGFASCDGSYSLPFDFPSIAFLIEP
jgi:hypothetical protein